MYQDSIEIVVATEGSEPYSAGKYHSISSSCIETWSRLDRSDVRKSKDNILYNLHDETLDRTTNGKGPIQDMLSKDIEN